MPGDDGRGLNRDAVVEAALPLVDELGVEGLSMRALADRLGVKAASLYWHLRDKEQLLELLAEALLDRVEFPEGRRGWRAEVTAACEALTHVTHQHRSAAPVVLASPAVVRRSRLRRELTRVLATTGVEDPEGVAFALIVQVVAGATAVPSPAAHAPGKGLTLRIDSGSWRVLVRAAPADAPVDVARSEGGGGAPYLDMTTDGEVVVRNRRGANRGAVELSRDHAWYIKLHGGTWNTTLDLTGLRITGVEMDSGGGSVTCILPMPHGIVPVRVNSGIVGVALHRPRRAAAHALMQTGSVKVRFDGELIKATMTDVQWDSPGGSLSDDRYDVTVCSGCVKVTMDATAPADSVPSPAVVRYEAASAARSASQVVALILDGIEHQSVAHR
ncbi:MAG: TetR family transcriptional regulator [Candidatus Dormibacteraeota bacterium]|nr:TetR family transcriptional regulator [Candidatus Dormibacteraeota bacterium]